MPDQVRPRLPGGFHLPPFGIHQLLAAIIVCVALWTLGCAWLALQAVEQWVGGWQHDVRIHVYLDPARAKDADRVARELSGIEGVVALHRISPAEAARWMQGWLGDVGLESKALRARLPISFELEVRPDAGEFLFDDMRDVARRYSAEVNESEIGLAQANRWLVQIRRVAMFASLLLALAMMLIISNTLRMTLLTRADEIQLMRLLGAREWFVRLPFVLEGIVMGAGAGLSAWLLLWPLTGFASEWLRHVGVEPHLWVLLLPMLVGGALVGCFGAAIATMRAVAPAGGE
ncbi:MAG: FtsX-like permease family protein [Zetaproteobacteria bacterium]|nr:MAG: FtsX-like permease family protein [Zetaproteobacteria bacterium]